MALATFTSVHPQVFANIDSDKEISQSDRELLLEQVILVYAEDAKVVADKVFEFCRSRQCSGCYSGNIASNLTKPPIGPVRSTQERMTTITLVA